VCAREVDCTLSALEPFGDLARTYIAMAAEEPIHAVARGRFQQAPALGRGLKVIVVNQAPATTLSAKKDVARHV
jgi:hypothetical protein